MTQVPQPSGDATSINAADELFAELDYKVVSARLFISCDLSGKHSKSLINTRAVNRMLRGKRHWRCLGFNGSMRKNSIKAALNLSGQHAHGLLCFFNCFIASEKGMP